MPGGSLGTIRGQIRLDVANAIAGYAAVRAANARTIGSMNDARNRMRGFGLAAVGMGAGFLAGFGMAVNAAADFEKKLDYFGAVNNATEKDMEGVRAKALELGRDTTYSAGQVADAFVEMGKAGVSSDDIIQGMADAMINLAQAADIDLAQATNIVTSQIQAYGLAAKDAAHVTNLMAGAANASIIDVTDIGVSMKYVGGVAHSLGITIDSTTDAISLLGKAGIKGSTAGTSLRQIMVSLAGGTNKAKNELKNLGIITSDGGNKFFDASGKAKSLSEVFQILQDHTADLTDKERLMAMKTIFNNRALAAASILTREGAAGFAEMNKEISKTTAADVAAKRMDNLAGDIRKLKGTFETLLIEGGTPFQAFLRSVVQLITQVIRWFSSLPAGLQTGIFAFMGIAGVVLVLAGGIALMGAALAGAVGAISSTIGAFRLLGPLIMTAVRATWALTIAALANPYVLLAMAVLALVAGMVLLYQKSEKFRGFIDGVGRALKSAFLATVEWFKGLPAFFSGVWDSISSLFTAGVDWVVKKWNEMIGWISAAPGRILASVTSLGSTILTFVQSVPGRVAEALSSAWDGFTAFLSDLPNQVGYVLGFVIGRMVRWSIEAWTWAQTTGFTVVATIVKFFQELPGKIGQFLSELWANFLKWAISFTASSTKFASDTYNSIVSWFEKMPGRVVLFLAKLVVGAKAKWDEGVAQTKKFGINVLAAIVQFFSQLPGRVSAYASDLGSRISRKWNEIVQWTTTAGSNIYNGIINWVSRMPGKVWDLLGNVIGAFKDLVSNAFSVARDFAGGLWDGFKDGLGIHSPSFIEKAMWAITKVTGAEAQKLKGQVRGMQNLSRGLQEIHDTAAQAGASPDWATNLAIGLRGPQSLAASLNPSADQLGLNRSQSSGAISKGSSGSWEALQAQRPITVTVHNPIAERASDSAAQKLRTLAALGAI